MKFGSPWSAGWGNPESCLTRLDAERIGGRIKLTVQARSDIPAAWYEVSRNSKHIDYVYLTPGELRTMNVPCEAGFSRQAIAVLRCGPVAVSMQRAARWYDGQTSRRATHWWTWNPEIAGSYDANGETALTGWTLTGLHYNLTQRVTGKATRGTLRVEMTVDGTAVDLEVYKGTTLLASGSGTVDGSVTLAGTLSGSVTVAADAATSTETLEIRWPASMRVKRGLTDPPSSVVATVAFDGTDGMLWTEPSDLTAGATYYYRFAAVSDTGEAGADSATVTIALVGPPVAPSGLAYLSGDADETVLVFLPSSTEGATHNVYLQQPGVEAMPETPCAAVVGEGTITLPAITGTGVARVLVRAVAGGVEDRVGASLALEYAADGAYVAPRPNDPTIRKIAVASGRTVTVYGSYPTIGEKGLAASLGIYTKQPGGAYGALVASANLGTAWNGVKEASVNTTLASNGRWWVKLVALTAGGVESDSYAEELVFVSDADPANVQPDGFNSRG
jgi:hypothetical protein